MMHATLSRLTALWPDALIEVVTKHPALLDYEHENVRTVSPVRWHPQGLKRMPWGMMLRYLSLYRAAGRLTTSWRRRNVLDVLPDVDAVVVSGGGFITDSFQGSASHVLGVLGLAARLDKPIALFGQGIGPVKSPRLREKAAAVLPSATIIGLREARASLPLLDALAVDSARVVVTGDDAIELAYAARPAELGNGIGLNVRVVGYSGVDPAALDSIRSSISAAGRQYGAPLLPVPVSHNRGDSDVRAVRSLLNDPTLAIPDALGTRRGLIEQIGRCRIVITGSYHAGVFALSQGIPAVCLSRSQYYDHKFLGLSDQFGAGCTPVSLAGSNVARRLTDAIDAAWASADEIRPQLLRAAERQVEAGRAAYQRFHDLISSPDQVAGARGS